MDMEMFLKILSELDKNQWRARVRKKGIYKGCIHLIKRGSGRTLFSTKTAVYYQLTQKEIHRGSFFCQELSNEFNFPWWDALEISYAEIKYGLTYNRVLRNRMLKVLGLPEEKIY